MLGSVVILGHFRLLPQPRAAGVRVFLLPFLEPPASPPRPPALGCHFAHIGDHGGAFPWRFPATLARRSGCCRAIKGEVEIDQKCDGFELCILLSIGRVAEWECRRDIFVWRLFFFFSFSSFERGLWLWGGELESWANLRLGQLPRRTQAGTALLSRPADAAGPRAPGAAGTRGWGRGGPRPSSAPRLGISYRASVLVFWRLFLLPRMLSLCRTPGFSKTSRVLLVLKTKFSPC